MVGGHLEQRLAPLRLCLGGLFTRKSCRLGAPFGEHALHLSKAPACAFVGAVSVGTILNLASHDKL